MAGCVTVYAGKRDRKQVGCKNSNLFISVFKNQSVPLQKSFSSSAWQVCRIMCRGGSGCDSSLAFVILDNLIMKSIYLFL